MAKDIYVTGNVTGYVQGLNTAVPDGVADDLVNRKLATYKNPWTSPASSSSLSAPVASSLTRWRAALARARAGGGNARFLILGDSTVNGSGASGAAFYVGNARFKNLQFKLARLLNGSYADTRFEAFFGAGNITTSFNAYDSRLNQTGTWVNGLTNLANTVGGSFFTNTAGSTMTIAPVATFDSFELIFAQSATQGTMQVSVDASMIDTVNAAGANGLLRKTYTTILGAHTITLTKTGAANNNVLGFRCWDSTKPEIEIIQAGSSGADSSLFVSNAQPWEALNQLSFIGADLVYVDITINDWIAGTALATYKSRLATLISTIQAAGGDVIIGTGNPSAISQTALATQQSYIDAAADQAAASGVSFLDMFTLFRSYEISNPVGLYTDLLHPNYNGYDMEAQALGAFLKSVR